MDFKDLPSRELKGGIQYLAKFENGYGASIIKHDYSYGGDRGFWELAVIIYEENGIDYSLSYSTPITDDVLGNLTESEVNNYLNKIKSL